MAANVAGKNKHSIGKSSGSGKESLFARLEIIEMLIMNVISIMKRWDG